MITKVIPEESIVETMNLINKAGKIVIVAHKRPDGDAVGSSLGLYHFLYSQEKETTIILPDGIPDYLQCLPCAKEILNYETQEADARKAISECNLIFCLDFNDISRIGELAGPIGESTVPKVMLDHHLHNSGFCDVTISHPEIASTSELVFRLICRMGYFTEMSLESAECICAGMLTDTGGLTYNANSPEIYSIICELLRKGVDKDALTRRLFDNYSESRMRLMGYLMYKKMQVMKEYQTAILTLSYDEMLKFNYKPGDSEGFVNMPLTIGDVICSIFIKEERGVMKLSFRSQGNFNVSKMASDLFGGGGHFNASGAESKLSMEETVKIVKEALPKYYKEYSGELPHQNVTER